MGLFDRKGKDEGRDKAATNSKAGEHGPGPMRSSPSDDLELMRRQLEEYRRQLDEYRNQLDVQARDLEVRSKALDVRERTLREREMRSAG